MKGLSWLVVVFVVLMWMALTSGCNRGSVKVSPVLEGARAPHSGWNIGPDLWLEAGDEAKVTGAVFWIEGADPNDIFE